MKMATATSSESVAPKSSMDSTFPVFLPQLESIGKVAAKTELDLSDNEGFETISEPTQPLLEHSDKRDGSKFMEALSIAKPISQHEVTIAAMAADNRMFTENQGIAHVSTTSPLLDLFSELERTVSGERLQALLAAAWKENPLATLKIIWNARSIHLGKGEQDSFYRCLGWMKDEHPKTVIANLQWLVSSTIETKVKKEDPEAAVLLDDLSMVENDFEVPHGGSHGYWKDLLNILVLAVNNELTVLGTPRRLLHARNVQKGKSTSEPAEESGSGSGSRISMTKSHKGRKQKILKKIEKMKKSRAERIKKGFEYNTLQKAQAKESKHNKEKGHHEHVLKMLEDSTFYRSLHFAVARRFAEQLRKDMDLVKSGKREDLNKLSLAGKWAPSLEGFHDKHTFICSSIAEALFPMSEIGEANDSRELYLRRARECYQRYTLSPIRKALEIVERDISAGTFENINYAKVPSLAMNNYKELFARKDLARYENYVDKVAEGKANISGAVLMPSTLIKQARSAGGTRGRPSPKNKAVDQLLAQKIASIQDKAIDGQWASLVQRIRDNGTLSSSIAVCDVSGSMGYPTFPDGTCPLDTAVGLSLLLAEVTEPPFGGCFITFSSNPEVCTVGGRQDTRSLKEKVSAMVTSGWSMNTDFVAVFERLLLPMAVKHQVKPEDMVKQVFVFSDMQFDAAQGGYDWDKNADQEQWETAYERIERKFQEAGYEVPKLIFWNLAGGRAGYDDSSVGDEIAPKPVTAATENAMLVGGYSQGMMKMFLEGGTFEAEEEEEDVEMDEDGKEGMVEVKKKKVTPLDGMWKAIGHKSYGMLRVVD